MTGRSKLSEKDVERGIIFDINATRALYQDTYKFNYIFKKIGIWLPSLTKMSDGERR